MSRFIGMFPPDSPRVVLLVIVDEPQEKHYGGSVAGPAFKNISEKMIGLLSLYPQLEKVSQRKTKKTKSDKNANGIAADKKMAIPPIRAVGFLCHRSLVG